MGNRGEASEKVLRVVSAETKFLLATQHVVRVKPTILATLHEVDVDNANVIVWVQTVVSGNRQDNVEDAVLSTGRLGRCQLACFLVELLFLLVDIFRHVLGLAEPCRVDSASTRMRSPLMTRSPYLAQRALATQFQTYDW